MLSDDDTQDTQDTLYVPHSEARDEEMGEVRLSSATRSNGLLTTTQSVTHPVTHPVTHLGTLSGSLSPSSTSRKTSRSNSFTSVIADFFFFGGFNNAHTHHNLETAAAAAAVVVETAGSGKCRDTLLGDLVDTDTYNNTAAVEVEDHNVDVEVGDNKLEVQVEQQGQRQRQTDDKDKDFDDNLCSICLESATHGEVLVTIPVCRHLFHETCLLTWFMRSMHLNQQRRGTNYDLFLFHVQPLSSGRSNVPEHSGCVCPLCKQDVARLCVAATEQDTV